MLNRQITGTTGTFCSSWQEPGTNLAAAVGCFQTWANANGKASLRNDGVLDEDTLCALISVTVAHPDDFPTPFPNMGQRCYGGGAPPAAAPAAVPEPPPMPAASAAAPAAAPPPAAPAAPVPEPPPVTAVTASEEKGLREKLSSLSRNEKIALGVASAITVGGVIYTATRKKR
jgi:hypothetical protein